MNDSIQFDIVVAVDRDRGIGKDGGMAWHLPPDLAQFKKITTCVPDPTGKNAVIMGRKTWDSLPPKFKPLPGRTNIVISRSGRGSACGVVASLDEALAVAANHSNIFVIGGAQIYALAFANSGLRKVYLTEVDDVFSCDVVLPILPERFDWPTGGEWLHHNGIRYRFSELAAREEQ